MGKSVYTHPRYADLVQQALAEDIGSGDVTTLALVAEGEQAKAHIAAKQNLVVAGIEIARAVFHQLDKDITWKAECADGDRLASGKVIAKIEGRAQALLTAERTALNFLQRLSGIATITAGYVELLKPYKATLKDTRKTTPTFRELEKYAVRCGGGENHRYGLFDGILIKDNHIAFAGGITKAINLARQKAPSGWPIEVETQNLTQVEEALTGGASIIMLDNMDIVTMRQAVELIGVRAKIEVSGGITAEKLIEIAEMGVDYISLGQLTHSAPAVDIHMCLL